MAILFLSAVYKNDIFSTVLPTECMFTPSDFAILIKKSRIVLSYISLTMSEGVHIFNAYDRFVVLLKIFL